MTMVSVRAVLSKILCVFTVVLALWTFARLVFFLSSNSSTDRVRETPCCGRFLWPLLWNVLLLNLFTVQHSVMASHGWKKMMMAIRLNAVFDRQLYVIASCVCLLLVVNFSNPMPGPELWYFNAADNPTLWVMITVLHTTMWFAIVVCAMMNDPLALVGLTSPASVTNSSQLLGQRSHVGLVAFLLIVWLQTAMTVQRFLIAVVFTLYVMLENRSASRIFIKWQTHWISEVARVAYCLTIGA